MSCSLRPKVEDDRLGFLGLWKTNDQTILRLRVTPDLKEVNLEEENFWSYTFPFRTIWDLTRVRSVKCQDLL